MYTTAERDVINNLLTSYYVGWLSAITDWRAGTVTELFYTGYARAQFTLGSGAATSPAGGRQRANTGAATGGQKTDAGTATAIAYGVYAASSGGSPVAIGMLSSVIPVIGTVTSASPGVITAPAHGIVADGRLFILGLPSGALPTGINENTAYYAGTVPSANSLTLSTTASNANAVNTSSVGTVHIFPYTALSIAQNSTPSFDVGAIVIQL